MPTAPRSPSTPWYEDPLPRHLWERGATVREIRDALAEAGYDPVPAPSTIRDRASKDGWQRLTTLSDALALEPLPGVPAAPVKAPKGWEDGIKFAPGAKTGTVTISAVDEAPTVNHVREHLRRSGFDPDRYDIHPREVRHDPAAWTRNAHGEDAVTAEVFRTRYDIKEREADAGEFDIHEFLAHLPKPKVGRPKKSTAPGETFLVGLADWQCGKRDQGGTEALVERLARLGPALVARIRELQALGRNIEAIVLAGLGDLVEGCVGFYPQQTFTVELDRREQLRVARRMLIEITKEVAALGVRVIVTGVPGNHGENRGAGGNKGGFTTSGDNDDMVVLETVAETFAAAPGYDHVSFVVPNQELSMTLDLSGRPTVFAHGHTSSGGWGGLWKWFTNQRAYDRTPATLFVCGHFHHVHYEEDGVLAMLQCSALEGGSDYYTERAGPATIPGTTTALVSSTYRLRDLAVL